jgi:hypothetical protein
MLVICMYIWVLGVLAQAVGLWFCANIPRESGERGMMQAAFWLLAPGALVLLLNTILSHFESPKLIALFDILGTAGRICMFAGMLFYLFSLRGVALSLKSTSLAKNAFACLLYTAAFLPVFLVYVGIAAAFSGPATMSMDSFGGDFKSSARMNDIPQGGMASSMHPSVMGSGIPLQMRGPRDMPRDMPSRGPSSMSRSGGDSSPLGMLGALGAGGTMNMIILAVLYLVSVLWFAYVLFLLRGQAKQQAGMA